MLESLRVVSARLGADFRHIQGPGGNTSVKVSGAEMYVKASGSWLAEANDRNIFTRVNPEVLRAALQAGRLEFLPGESGDDGLRPSMEAALHAVLPHRYVMHTHSLSSVATCCRADAQAVIRERLRDYHCAWIDYVCPGPKLAKRILAATESDPDTSVFFLGNHGLVVGADTAEEAATLVEAIGTRLARPARAPIVSSDRDAVARLAREHRLVAPPFDEVHDLALDPVATAIVSGGSLYPDHVVFLGAGVGTLLTRQDAAAMPVSLRPKLWLAPGQCVLLEPGLAPAAGLMALALARVAAQIPEGAPVRYLSTDDEAALDAMGAEHYRRQLAAGGD